MIGVIDIFIAIKPSLRIASYNGIRFELSNESGEILAQRKGWFQLPIWVAEEERLLNSKHLVGGELFSLPQFRQFLFMTSILGRVVRTGVATGNDHRNNLTSGTRPFGNRTAHAELLVVRMRVNTHRNFGKIFS